MENEALEQSTETPKAPRQKKEPKHFDRWHNREVPAPPPGKNHYDKWMGKWIPKEKIRNPFDGKEVVTLWFFERQGSAPNKTCIPLTEQQAKKFNDTRSPIGIGVVTEQLYPAGKTDDLFLRSENPFEAIKL